MYMLVTIIDPPVSVYKVFEDFYWISQLVSHNRCLLIYQFPYSPV